MTIDEIPSHFREALAVHEAFRKLGFSPDDIYLALAHRHTLGSFPPTNPGSLFVTLKAQGLEFWVTVGNNLSTNHDEIVAQWKVIGEWWNTAPHEDQHRIWTESVVMRDKVGFLIALNAKGFVCSHNLN